MGGKIMARIEIKEKLEFATSLRLELFYALEVLINPASRIHRSWRERSLANMPKSFFSELKKLGNSPAVWALIADTLHRTAPDISFELIISELKNQRVEDFQREILYGAIHYNEIVDELLTKNRTLPQMLSKVPKPKQEWLAFIGLFPYQGDSEMAIALSLLLENPSSFKDTVIKTLEMFWSHAFKDTWRILLPQFQKSLEEKERLLQSCTFEEFAGQALLRIEVDETRQVLKAVRGGAILKFKNVTRGYLMPSAFNDKRYWTTSDTNGKSIVFFPYFDPSLSLGLSTFLSQTEIVAPELDVCLIFKALSDPTRIAMISIISETPTSSVDLAKYLSISKPAVSHHVHLLRDAGLISETHVAGSIHLSTKRDVLESLSRLAIDRFFSQSTNINNMKIRSSL
jgi:DNA-binding transcriptional ArsR family regulator